VGGWTAHDGLNCRSHGLRFSYADEAAIGFHNQNAIIVGAVEQFNERIFRAQMDGLDAGNLHRTLPTALMIKPSDGRAGAKTARTKE
jgi:hypothetical protein